MNQDQSSEAQPEFRSQHLSPVSPKPVFFPQPSNIPILENQMDPSLSESSVYSGDAIKNHGKADLGYMQALGSGQSENEQTLQTATEEDEEEDQKISFVAPGQKDGERQDDMHQTPESISQTLEPSQALQITDAQFNEPVQTEDMLRSPNTLEQPDDSANTQISSNINIGEAMSQFVAAMNTTGTLREPQAIIPDKLQGDDTEATATNGLSGPVQTGQGDTVDIQALLDNIVNGSSPSLTTKENQISPQEATLRDGNELTPSQSAPNASTATNLPARPPFSDGVAGPEETNTHPLQAASHVGTASQSQIEPPGASYHPLANIPPPSIVGAPGTAGATTSLPPPPLASFQRSTSAVAGSPTSTSAQDYRQRDALDQPSNDDLGDEEVERRWGPEVQKKYDAFLEDERVYVMKGEWEKFPASSRLFIEKVTKRDLFHVFHKYGKLAQVSIKQAYGFVQFLVAQDCIRALDAEQGVSIRGRKIHLEISKPQRNKNQGGGRDGRARRSRSPDNRGGAGNPKGIDRYRSGDNRQRGGRRSPSPRSRGGRRNSPDRSGRRRSRSPYGRFRRDASPSRDADDDCPLPRRQPQDVPDVQVIVKDNPDRAFISYVEKSFEARGLRTNVLLLSPRLPESAVMRRQIIEGVIAVTKIDRTNQMSNKFQLSVFDRSQGANNVRFEEYANLDLNICIELVLRAKQTARIPPSGYQNGLYGLPLAQQQQQQHQQQLAIPPAPQPPPHSQVYGQHQQQQSPQTYQSFDASAIQSLLSRVQQQGAQQPAYPSVQTSLPQVSDLSRLLASAGASQPQQPALSSFPGSGGIQQGQPSTYTNYASLQSPTTHFNQSPTSQQQPQYPPSQPVDMKNIMAGLARWKG